MSDVILPFPQVGLPCPKCATMFKQGPAAGPIVDGVWYPHIDCAACKATFRLVVGSVGLNGVEPWHLKEIAVV